MPARRPPPRIINDPRDAEAAARDWMIYLGYHDARMTVIGPDEGVDVTSSEAVAQVKSGGSPTGRPVVQQIYGAAQLEGKEGILFTVGGVTDGALDWADRSGIALFELDLSGDARAANGHARAVMTDADRALDGWAAVTAELESRRARGEQASITAEFFSPDGYHGYWGIWVSQDGKVRVTRDLVGATRRTVESVTEAVTYLAAALDELKATYWDSRPMLTTGKRVRRFVPQVTYPTPSSRARGSSRPAPSEDKPIRVTASDIYGLLNGPGCNRRIYLAANGIEQSPPSALQVMLMDLGMEHEEHHRTSIEPLVDLSDGSMEARAAATLGQLRRGEATVFQGVLETKLQVGGIPLRVIGVPDFMLPDGDSHIIRDTKTAINVDEGHRPDIAGQLRFYGWLYRQVMGRSPAALQVVAGDGTIHAITRDAAEPIESVVQRVAALKGTSVEPGCFVKWSYRTSCPYFQYCWSRAVEEQGVSTVPGLSRNAAELLHDSGIRTISDLVQQHSVETLADVVVPRGSKHRRLGRRAERILNGAKALSTGRAIVHGDFDVPEGDVVLFDLEGTPSLGGQVGYVYLWGTSVNGASPLEYEAVLAGGQTPEDDARGWSDFLRRAATILDRYGDIPWLHWASYEKTQLNSYIERYGDPDGTALRVLDLLVDLLKVTRSAVTLPVHSYSLKSLEQYVGFQRSQTEFGGDWSITMWQEAIATTTTPDARSSLLAELATYNYEDLEGMAAVLERLRELSTV